MRENFWINNWFDFDQAHTFEKNASQYLTYSVLLFFDIVFTILHLVLIGFNLVGWIFPSTRRWHLLAVMLTAGSWVILGFRFGPGYCPITDWQWDIKRARGITELPPSFITWFLEQTTGRSLSDSAVSGITAVVFAAVSIISIYLNWRDYRKKKLSDVGLNE